MLCFSSLCMYKWRRQSDNHHPKRILIMNFYFMLNYFWNLFKTLCETVDALCIFLGRFAFFWLCNYKQKKSSLILAKDKKDSPLTLRLGIILVLRKIKSLKGSQLDFYFIYLIQIRYACLREAKSSYKKTDLFPA